MKPRSCPALMLAAPASGQGKTTVTAALARYHRNAGRRVRVFKAGPDFLDPMVHSRASGHAVDTLDLWMTGEADIRQRLYQAAGECDLILIEGVMGLYDGKPSCGDIAALLGIPVLLLLNAAAMAQTFGALASGLARFRSDVPFAGVFANQVSGERHVSLLTEQLPEDLPLLGYLPKRESIVLPSRHLGIVQAQEIDDLELRLEAAAKELVWTHDGLPAPVAFTNGVRPQAEADGVVPHLSGKTIAVARDDAFAFIYPANLALLEAMGAQLVFFSPVAGEGLPEADAVYLPGGYPELHLQALAENDRLRSDLQAHVAADKPLLAECGGMLYLFEELADKGGESARMAGLLPGKAKLESRLAGLGPQQVDLPEGRLRGHTFHHSSLDTPLQPLTRATSPIGRSSCEAVYRQGPITASYVHLYFPSNPQAVAALLGGTESAG
ncbi:hydrogenobyrinic acid a,c-diamide synthase (glutamine-hydrolysing) /cobyrinate a,c-diamide synthase [Ectothiorhodosinus mongolicus]|uniref:Hydrogenobyrinic acid a,c-diamide synthase (Glutamine-hydrolysing) /cobyrinate a,c-diamide synthase n=1 Tax=Ectothiorhodosinus mongolicus TaxID=233100 RepID=A0A1R3W4L2_9GAMM|nr:cobyrinate a,c-diamide synthase [Ectothiorhodosinus mongolicus]ULX57551.1 cobyrinate a,c-diamide synthase [Ectothiorhodosinus mongolicus]SIT72758.1 hydrogenobyrinic acid a,c-diamide synthase (glutamine-hydrolysing) /cobyrinate a,c-diamide synthase [Ectothiorhodosinus mongolicus]